MTKVLDTPLLPLFSLKHTHLYMTTHITTFHISTFSLTIRMSQRSWQVTGEAKDGGVRGGGVRGGGVSGGGGGGGGGCVCVKGKELQNDEQRAARCRAEVKGGGVRGEERQIDG
jgi:hypothetical protein